MDELVAAHERRFRELDPLLPATHPLPQLAPDEQPLVVGGGIGLARRIRTDPDSAEAAWSAVDQHRLIARVGGADPVRAMDALLTGWHGRVAAAAAPDDPDSAATLSWPSRDTAVVRLYADRGLLPQRIVPARLAGRPAPDGSPDVRVRPLEAADLDDAVELNLAQIRWDAQFGGATLRPSAGAALRQEYLAVLAQDEPWTWIAEVDGRTAGMLTVTPPGPGTWFAPFTGATSPAYVGCTVTVAGQRGGGVGAAMARHAHAALDRAGVDVALLHYNLFNPLSGPFWHRCGYRPLWTSWELRPASRLRPGGR
jgi:GNAT superfamily N-acetyltransferase